MSRFVAVVTNTVNTIMPPYNPIEQTVAFWNINPFVINRDPEVPEELFELARLFHDDMTELHS